MNWLLLLAALTFPDLVTGTQHHEQSWTAPRVCISGQGPNGTDRTGPIIRFGYGATDGIVLGAGDPFRATGTLIERVRVVRQGTGGTAIKIVALSVAERPGEIVIRDVLTCGMSDLQGGTVVDNWDTALLIDGGPVVGSGVAGIRRTRIDHFRAASCVGDAIVFKNVTHLAGTDIQGDRGTSGRVPTLVIEDSRDVNLSQLNWFGEVHLRGANSVINIDGYAQVIYVSEATIKINVRGTIDRMVVYAEGKPPMILSNVTSWSRMPTK